MLHRHSQQTSNDKTLIRFTVWFDKYKFVGAWKRFRSVMYTVNTADSLASDN